LLAFGSSDGSSDLGLSVCGGFCWPAFGFCWPAFGATALLSEALGVGGAGSSPPTARAGAALKHRINTALASADANGCALQELLRTMARLARWGSIVGMLQQVSQQVSAQAAGVNKN